MRLLCPIAVPIVVRSWPWSGTSTCAGRRWQHEPTCFKLLGRLQAPATRLDARVRATSAISLGSISGCRGRLGIGDRPSAGNELAACYLRPGTGDALLRGVCAAADWPRPVQRLGGASFTQQEVS